MANEDSAIWQVQSGTANGSESTAGAANTILFNASPVIGSGGLIFNQEFNIRNSTPENESVGANNNEVEDMGIDGIDVQITGTFIAKDTNTSISRLIRFMKEPKGGVEVVGYEEGRFGLRLDNFPHFNVTPDGNGSAGGSTFGYILASIRFIDDGAELNRVGFIATLRLSGDLENAI